jgi:Fic family protein
LDEIAKAHAWFIAIHPFGDGNGRVSRALVMAQCLNARLMPPIFDGENRAMYCAAMEHAMVHGRYAPLVRLFHEPCRVDKELYRLPTV